MNSNWNPSYPYSPYTMRYGARVGGLAIAFQCIGVISILAFGLTLMGTIMTAVSYNDPFADEPFFAKHPNPIKIVGPVVLTIGLILAIGSIILCVLSVKTGHRLLSQQQSSQPVQTTVNTCPLISQGSQPYPSPNLGSQPYSQQPYPSPNQGSQHYPQQQANQYVLNKEFTDVSLPYPTSVNETSTP